MLRLNKWSSMILSNPNRIFGVVQPKDLKARRFRLPPVVLPPDGVHSRRLRWYIPHCSCTFHSPTISNPQLPLTGKYPSPTTDNPQLTPPGNLPSSTINNSQRPFGGTLQSTIQTTIYNPSSIYINPSTDRATTFRAAQHHRKAT